MLVDALRHELSQGRLRDSERLLDIGCGTGFLLNRIHSEVCSSWQFSGIDFAAQAIEKGKVWYPHLQLFCEDGTATRFPDGHFSVLISYGSIEHFKEPLAGIKEAARLLRPHGLFLIMIPTLGVYRTDRCDEGWYKDLTGQPQWNLRRDTWETCFTQCDLSLWGLGVPKRFGALKPGVFYFGTRCVPDDRRMP